MYMPEYSSEAETKIAVIGIIIMIIITVLMHSCQIVTTEATYDVVVMEKAVKRIDEEDRYLVYTKLLDTGEIRVFQITDSISRMRFDSADRYDSIKVGKSYRFEVYGMREEHLSNYENIIAISEIIPDETTTETETEITTEIQTETAT